MGRAGVLGTTVGAVALAIALLAGPAGAAPKARPVPDSGLVTVGQVRCAAREPCVVKTPRKAAAKVGGLPVRAKVIAPPVLGRGAEGKVKLSFAPPALSRLAGHTATFRVRVVVRAGGKGKAEVLRAKLSRRAEPEKKESGPGKGLPGGETPHSEPVTDEPPVMPRPLTAQTVSAVTLTWYPRDSWLRYIAAGVAAGDGTTASGGATGIDSTASPCPDHPAASSTQLPYTIEFTPAESWYDPPSGTADVTGVGSVSFRYHAHTINLTASEPEIQIAGAASQAIFRMSGTEGTPYPNQRVSLLTLNTAGKPSVSGGTYTYEMMRGTLTPDGEGVFAGFYPPPDNVFGCVSVGFTVG